MIKNEAVKYDPIAASSQSTVVAVHPVDDDAPAQGYQTEAELEDLFLSDLTSQGYEYLTVRSEQSLVDNLRRQLERLNHV